MIALDFTSTLTAFNAGLFVSPGYGRHPDRTIDTFDLIFVVQGKLAMREGGTPYTVQTGEYLLLRPHQRHAGTHDYPADLQFYWVHFSMQGAPPQTPVTHLTLPSHGRVSRPEHLIQLFRRFLDDQETSGEMGLSGALLVQLMLLELARPPLLAKQAVPLADQAHRIIQSRFHEKHLSTQWIARELKSNPDYLGRLYRGVYGMTLTESLHRARLHMAARLLAETAFSVDQVALKCGFEDTGYFRRLFKRQQGMTPVAYRRINSRVHINTL
ncbi:AraC family transcriptional regulator [Deinococcus misasensis]|uniref:AraC family transcriptional regulator n=1 Tax=Deinococcus misasensis TaxID=392413 RepID=UPI00068FAB8D|nr:AraC family transcriptional regulator [Deinococcus misasensis]